MNSLSTSWVVYRMSLHNKPAMNAVCEQSEWEAIELSRPGYHTLVKSGIATEAEAEWMARSQVEAKPAIRLKSRM